MYPFSQEMSPNNVKTTKHGEGERSKVLLQVDETTIGFENLPRTIANSMISPSELEQSPENYYDEPVLHESMQQPSANMIGAEFQTQSGEDIIQVMKEHLRTKYAKYQNYTEQELEARILRFLQDYLSEIKAGGKEMIHPEGGQGQEPDNTSEEYGSMISIHSGQLDSTLDWADNKAIEKRIAR